MPKSRLLTFISIGMILAGAALTWFGTERTVLLEVDGTSRTVLTRALTVNGAVKAAGYVIEPADRIIPGPSAFLLSQRVIRLDRAQTVKVENNLDGTSKTLLSSERIPANLLAAAGIPLFPGDRLTINGMDVDPYSQLTPGSSSTELNFHPAVAVTLQDGSKSKVLYSSADTLVEALWQSGISLSLGDQIAPAANTRLVGPTTVIIQRAQPVTIQIASETILTASSAGTVGELLTGAGITLQGLDYSVPAEGQPVPANRQVKVVRVREEVNLEQQSIPYKSSYQQDNQTELDQRRVITPGEFGIRVSRVRIRLEDGVETSRTAEAEWVAKKPQNQLVGYGTQAVVKTIDTPYGALEYWRAVNVFATSYSPCRLGIPNYCNNQTASGAPVRQGIVAVTRAWYSWMRGQRVYIPGYGVAVVGDVGGGIPGRYWVDLGYQDADYKSWASNVTMYFLSPVPAAIPWILP